MENRIAPTVFHKKPVPSSVIDEVTALIDYAKANGIDFDIDIPLNIVDAQSTAETVGALSGAIQGTQARHIYQEEGFATRFNEAYDKALKNAEANASTRQNREPSERSIAFVKSFCQKARANGVEIVQPDLKSWHATETWLKTLRSFGIDHRVDTSQVPSKPKVVDMQGNEYKAEPTPNTPPIDPSVGKAQEVIASMRKNFYLDRDNDGNLIYKSRGMFGGKEIFRAVNGWSELRTQRDDAESVKAMLAHAIMNGWSSIKVSGTQKFQSNCFVEACRMGIEIKGYTPIDSDMKALAKEGIKPPEWAARAYRAARAEDFAMA